MSCRVRSPFVCMQVVRVHLNLPFRELRLFSFPPLRAHFFSSHTSVFFRDATPYVIRRHHFYFPYWLVETGKFAFSSFFSFFRTTPASLK